MSITPKMAAGAAQRKPAASVPAPTQEPGANLLELLNGPEMQKRLVQLFSDNKMKDRYLGIVTGAVRTTPLLAQCTPASFVGALIKCAALGLEPNTPAGQCYFIPRKIKGNWECCFELGYKGVIDLAYRSDEISVIKAKVVHERDLFDIDYGKPQDGICHKPYILGDRGKVVGYWAQWIGKDGNNSDVLFMSQWEMDQHVQQYVKSIDSDFSPWNTAYDKMALKTVIKQVLKFAPLSVSDLRHAEADDGTIIIDAETGKIISGTPGPRLAAAQSILTAPPGEFARAPEAALNVTPQEQQQPEPAPAAQPAQAPAPPAQPSNQALADQAEAQRLEMLARLKEVSGGVDPLMKFGMPWPMVDRQPMAELFRFYKMVSP